MEFVALARVAELAELAEVGLELVPVEPVPLALDGSEFTRESMSVRIWTSCCRLLMDVSSFTIWSGSIGLSGSCAWS
jgi:hypothetical protein